MKVFFKLALAAFLVFSAIGVYFIFSDAVNIAGMFFVLGLVSLSYGIRVKQTLKGLTFTVLIFAAVCVSMFFPKPFVELGGFKMSNLIVPLLQLIMFGMGTSMSLKDFVGVIKMPKGVFIGIALQFTIMPLLGFTLAYLFNFPAEIAAGIVLIGSSPSGLASNVMVYLAKANIALSVTLTSVSTLLAPLFTPLLMKLYAGQLIEIQVWDMTLSIIKIVIIPVIFGLLFNHFLKDRLPWVDKVLPKLSMFGIAFIITVITASGRDNLLSIGLLLIVAAIIHNLLGFLLGYWSCRALKMSEAECRTIAIEVGMQNGGLASGIALEMGKVSTVGLAPAIFGPWMNISGSSLAFWWREKPLKEHI